MKIRNATTEIIDPVVVICYGEEEFWGDRNEAIKFYLEGMMACEGAERDRYTNIYCQLIDGFKVCNDKFDYDEED